MSKKRKLRTAEEMYPLIEAWSGSGQSKSEFCLAHDLRLNTFSYWHKKYSREKNGELDIAEKLVGEFVRVNISSESAGLESGLRLDCGHGVLLDFLGLPPASYLVSVLKGLR